MILLLCGLVTLAVVGAVILAMASSLDSIICAVLGMISVVIGCIGLIIYCALVMDDIGSEHKARIMNREYGTHYTQEEVFYASSVIDTVRELDRKRMEINGDILKAE